MSSTEMIGFDANEEATILMGEYRNSHAAGPCVWDEVAKVVLGWEKFPMFDETRAARFWDCWKHTDVPEWIRIVLLSTYDNFYIKRENWPQLIEAFKTFCRERPEAFTHLQAYVDDLNKAGPEVTACCWHLTSICESPWEVYVNEEEGYAPYSMKTGDKHQEAFEVIAQWRSEQAAR